MKRKLVFATNNAHKLEEISAILGEKVNNNLFAMFIFNF